MPLPNFFTSDAFSMISLTASVNEMPFVPGRVGQLGIFRSAGVNTRQVVIEKKGSTLTLIPTSEAGSPPEQRGREKRDIRLLSAPRLSREAVIQASQVSGVRAFGSESEFEGVQQVLNEQMGKTVLEMDMTIENLRLGAVKGIVIDADGTTVLYNLFTEFGVSQLAEFDFALDTATTDVRLKCMELRRLMSKEVKAGNIAFGIHALCGDSFFDKLIAHDSTKTAWERWSDGQTLRQDLTFQTFFHAGIMFENYRGSDDGAVGVATTKAHFFPTGVPGLFENPFAPGDTIDTVNTVGLPRYAFPNIDPRPNPRWASVEIQSNPLPFCTRPRTLIKAKEA